MPSATANIIVVGGGPVGLTVAHALTRANIDFVLLESRPSIVMTAGASLVLSQIGLRALSQFGILPALEKVSSPLSVCKRFDHRGRTIGDIKVFSHLHENHGCASRVITRRNLMQVLFDALPVDAQRKILPGKKVSGLHQTEDGVVVRCMDGTSYEGSLVLGADGAYSAVRRYMTSMNDQGNESNDCNIGQRKEEDQEPPYLTTYRCFWMRFPRLPGVIPGDMTESHGWHATTQYFVNEDSAVVAVYERLPQPTHLPPRHYSESDEVSFIAKWGHLPLNDNPNYRNREGLPVLTLESAYAHKIQSGFINLEEGVVAEWSRSGRAVLVGDAAHKFTPSTGAGCNNGIIDVVVLVNKLHKVFTRAAGSIVPVEELATVFREYQESRSDIVTLACTLSGRATKNATWHTPWARFMDLYILSNDLIVRLFLWWVAKRTAATPAFDFIQGEERIIGKYPWLFPIGSTIRNDLSSS